MFFDIEMVMKKTKVHHKLWRILASTYGPWEQMKETMREKYGLVRTVTLEDFNSDYFIYEIVDEAKYAFFVLRWL